MVLINMLERKTKPKRNNISRYRTFVKFFLVSLPQLSEMLLFIREMNEPVVVNQAKLFPSYYTNRVVHLFTILLQSIVHICEN